MVYQVFPDTIGPSFPVDVSSEPKVLRTEFGDGYTGEAPDGINYNLKTFNLTWDVLTTAEKVEIIDFLDARGGYQTFEWEFETVTYRVKCRKWSHQLIEPTLYKVTATFEQVPI